ncbi:MAG: phosphate ABC transporter substrate-binding protein [Oscillospiraceae bacterium]|nr:phosphate ABC transporter substrate-binding protein [Oscillospiraceae bacterium]
MSHNFVKLIRVPLVGVLFLSCLLSSCAGKRDCVIVAGSTSVQPYAEVLAEEYAILHPEGEIDVQGGGSSAGITAVRTGTADIGMSSRELSEKEQDLWSVEIAKDGLAIIVHPDNPIKDLSLEQIRHVYSAAITDWSELGGNPAKIHIIAREDGSGTRSAFDSLVMDTDEVSPRAIIQDSNGTVRLLVSNDRNSIGFISLGLVDDSVKALSIDGVTACKENVINGSYSLFRPFLFICAEKPEAEALHFIDFVLSEEGKRMLADEGLISLTEIKE